MSYNKLLETLFFNPLHVGTLDCSMPLTACSRVRVRHGVRFDLYMACEAMGWIQKACFKAYGSPYLIAGLEWLCREVEGTNIKEPFLPEPKTFIEQLAIPRFRQPDVLLIAESYQEVLDTIKQLLGDKQQ